MTWKIEFERDARRELERLGSVDAKRIGRTLVERIAVLENPRAIGDPLVGKWTGYWRYRMGNYRVIARIEDDRLVIVVVRVAHRREVYQR